jgi:hypothetical protein
MVGASSLVLLDVLRYLLTFATASDLVYSICHPLLYAHCFMPSNSVVVSLS